MFEFFLMDIDGNFSPDKMLQASCVIHMEVAENDCPYVLNVIACGRYGFGELVMGTIVRPREHIGGLSTPLLCIDCDENRDWEPVAGELFLYNLRFNIQYRYPPRIQSQKGSNRNQDIQLGLQ